MKKLNSHIIPLLATVMCIAGSCKNDDTGISALGIREAVYNTSANAMQLTLKDNATLQLTPVTMPMEAVDGIRPVYTNRHPEWLNISETGMLTPQDFGGYDPVSRTDTLTITAGGISTNYQVIISNHMLRVTAINVTSVGANIQLKKGGKTFNLKECLTFVPADAYNTAIEFSSEDPSVATVDANGIVTSGNDEGSTTITITTKDGGNIVRTVNITILGIQPVNLPRTGWTAKTAPSLEPEGFNYTPAAISWIPDKVTVGTTKVLTGGLEHMFDDEPLTYMCLEKPGRGVYACKVTDSGWSGTNAEYGALLTALLQSVGADADSGTSANPTADVINYFVVDMKAKQNFSYLLWRHRNAANNRVLTIDLYGSDNGAVYTGATADVDQYWTKLNTEPIDLSAKQDNSEQKIDITVDQDVFSYRYLKVVALTYPSSGMTFGVAEFGLGYYE